MLYIFHSAILDWYIVVKAKDCISGGGKCVSYLNINWQSHWLFYPNICKLITCYTTFKMAVFWDVALCSLVHINQCFRGAYCLHHYTITLIMEAVSSSETLASIYQTAWCNSKKTAIFILSPWEPEISHCTTLFCIEESLALQHGVSSGSEQLLADCLQICRRTVNIFSSCHGQSTMGGPVPWGWVVDEDPLTWFTCGSLLRMWSTGGLLWTQ
jgi:hypothetical protein